MFFRLSVSFPNSCGWTSEGLLIGVNVRGFCSDEVIEQENFLRYKDAFSLEFTSFGINPKDIKTYKEIKQAFEKLTPTQLGAVRQLTFNKTNITRVADILSLFPNLSLAQIKSNPIDYIPEKLIKRSRLLII